MMKEKTFYIRQLDKVDYLSGEYSVEWNPYEEERYTWICIKVGFGGMQPMRELLCAAGFQEQL